MTATSDDTAATWPFWAPSRQDSVAEALDLAGVGSGTTFVDLGCGDGQVVAAAASRGAEARGIEADADLVAEARHNLETAGLRAGVVEADLFDPATDLVADVVFTYLAPATLQRLLPRLQPHRGVRLVAVDFDVPGLVPNRRSGSARLYRMPGRRRPVPDLGWGAAGSLVAAVPDCHSLSCLEAVHPAGATDVACSPGLAEVVTAFQGSTALSERGALAVDLRWEPVGAGTVAAGTIRTRGLAPHPVTVVFTDEDDGIWELTSDAVDRIRRARRRRRPPTTLGALLAAAES